MTRRTCFGMEAGDPQFWKLPCPKQGWFRGLGVCRHEAKVFTGSTRGDYLGTAVGIHAVIVQIGY